MYITWLGHSCFRLESAGYGLVIDPYRVVAGYPPLRMEANAVYISHHHFDHDCLEAVTLLPAGKIPLRWRRSPPSMTTVRALSGAITPFISSGRRT